MTAVQRSHDYATAVPIRSDDEIGVLASSFNRMIGEISERDLRLARHRESLEQEVAERTVDLRAPRTPRRAPTERSPSSLATMSHEIRTPMNGCW
jgi:nitrate/nitrite-specific signal transduction histidine kinase